MADPHKNFGYSTVLTAPSPATSGTSLVVQSGDGTKFPSSGSFNATIWPVSTQPTTANAEIVRVTAISTDTFTIIRAQESTSARTVIIGDQIADTVTAKTLTDVELNVYVTDQDKTIPITTQVKFDDYLELAASFFYELSTDAVLVIGDFATPLPLPDQNTNIFVSVANETIPSNSEVIFSSEYEVSAPFVTEVAGGGLLQVGTSPDIVGPFLPGYELGYDQITVSKAISSTTEATGDVIISCAPHMFDGAPVFAHFFSAAVTLPTASFVAVSLFEGTTQVSEIGTAQAIRNTTPVGGIVPTPLYFRFTPTAGLHTYTVTAFVGALAGSPSIGAGTAGTGNNPPAFIRFTKV